MVLGALSYRRFEPMLEEVRRAGVVCAWESLCSAAADACARNTTACPSQVVTTLSAWSCESRNHLRVKMRFLLERIVRKFGYDAVARFVPESDMKLLACVARARPRCRVWVVWCGVFCCGLVRCCGVDW